MRLFPRTLVIIALTSIVLIIVFNIFMIMIVGVKLNDFEEQSITKDSDRVGHLLGREESQWMGELRDNAHWDLLYDYMENPNGSFLDAFFVGGTFYYMNINFVLTYHENGSYAEGVAYDFGSNEVVPVATSLLEFINDNPYLKIHKNFTDDHSLFTRMVDEVVMIGSSPILTNEETGPIHGSMVMGRYLDKIEIASLAALGDVDLDYRNAFDPNLPQDYQDAMADLALTSTNHSFLVLEPDRIASYTPVRGPEGNILMILKVSDERMVYNEGMMAFQLLNVILFFVLIVDSIALLFLIGRYVVKPVSHLNQEMHRAGVSGDLSARVKGTDRDDEIDQLTGSFNEMMGELELKDKGLKDSEQRYRDLVENSTDWIWQTDKEWRFVFSNGIVTTHLGLAVDALKTKKFLELVEATERDDLATQLNQKMQERKPIRGFIMTMKSKEGRKVVFEMNAQPVFDESGKWNGYRGMARDITDRVRNEKALEKSNKQLTLLSSITRHDILNQATILSGYGELLRENIKDPITIQHLEKQQKAIDTVVRQIKFTGIYQQLGTQEPIWQDISRILDSVIRQLDLHNLHIELNIGNMEVLADPIMERVFYNLIENVVRHSGASELRVSEQVDGGALVIILQDNGKGVPMDMKERIFARGYGQNSGLGLFLVREVLATTSITITENGLWGSGARFEIRVPITHWRRVSS
jgi:PAS domain S-box-containing protein